MATRPVITQKGLELLGSSAGQNYWLGYYLLAYVPNIWKVDTVELPVDNCGKYGSGTIITSTDSDKVAASMTQLTKYGDVIYNIWQGDAVGTGYGYEGSDGTAGGELFGMSYYDTSIKKHYRYVLDENGINNLVTWIDDSAGSALMTGKYVYVGTDGYYQSAIPIPASLYYLPTGGPYISVADYYPDITDSDQNGSSLYPYINVTYKVNSSTPISMDIPKVSTDYRSYNDSIYDTDYPTAGGVYFNAVEIPYATDSRYDETGWFCASKTRMIDYVEVSNFSTICRELWKLHTISNYNRFHAPVSEVGSVLKSDLANRNMSTLTKFFPIANYKVINSQRGTRVNGDIVDVATSIAITIDLDLAPKVLAPGYDESGSYDEEGNLSFFDNYDNPANPIGPNDQNGENVYNTTHTSFKFNRIGFYAVPMRQVPYVDTSVEEGGINKVQYQINPDMEPVLFAVVDWDNTVSLDDTGNGIHQFHGEFDVNLESPNGVAETGLLRDAPIFYNLYQDDALMWYQNQLIANASTSNAITEMALEIANLKKDVSNNSCCGNQASNETINGSKNNFNGLRNLKDSNKAFDGGLKGIGSYKEGSALDMLTTNLYKLGKDSIALGKNCASAGDYSSVLGGVHNIITSTVTNSSITGGEENGIDNGTDNSITGGKLGLIQNSNYSGISASKGSRIVGTIYIEYAHISGGLNNYIQGYASYASINGGEGNYIDGHAEKSGINFGAKNIIDSYSDLSFIDGGVYNTITGTSRYSGIASSVGCKIGNSDAVTHIELGDTIIGSTNSYIDTLTKTTDTNTTYEVPYQSNAISGSTGVYIYDSTSSQIIGSEVLSVNNCYRSSVLSSTSDPETDITVMYRSITSSLIATHVCNIYNAESCIIHSSNAAHITPEYPKEVVPMDVTGIDIAQNAFKINTPNNTNFYITDDVIFNGSGTLFTSTPQVVKGVVYKLSAIPSSTWYQLSTVDGTAITISAIGSGTVNVYNVKYSVSNQVNNCAISSTQSGFIVDGATSSITSSGGCYIFKSSNSSITANGGTTISNAFQSSVNAGGGHSIIGYDNATKTLNSSIIAGQDSYIAVLKGDQTNYIDSSVILTGRSVYASRNGEVVQGAITPFIDTNGYNIVGGSQVSRFVATLDYSTSTNTNPSDYITIATIDMPPHTSIIGTVKVSAYGISGSYVGSCLSQHPFSIISRSFGDSLSGYINPSTPSYNNMIVTTNDTHNIVHNTTISAGVSIEWESGVTNLYHSINSYGVDQTAGEANQVSIKISPYKTYDGSVYTPIPTKLVAVIEYTQTKWDSVGYVGTNSTSYLGNPDKVPVSSLVPII